VSLPAAPRVGQLLRPAIELYQLLLNRGIRRPLNTGKRQAASSAALGWLPPSLVDEVSALFDGQKWLPQAPGTAR
jgi:hypothetical protein